MIINIIESLNTTEEVLQIEDNCKSKFDYGFSHIFIIRLTQHLTSKYAYC